MRTVKHCCLLLTLAVLAGCGKSMETARQLAAHNVYKEVAYENAAHPGPSVVVLPGVITSPSYEFLANVKPDTLLEYGELELGKANFKIVERNSLASIYQEIALAANLGDGSMSARFAKVDLAPPQWLILFDIADVQTQTTAFSYSDKNSASFAGALVGSFFGSAEIGQSVMGSISNAKEQRAWNITMHYRILDGATGRKLHEGKFTEQATINRELKGFMGVDTAQASGLTLGTVTQRLVQKAVQDIDRQHKMAALAQAATTPESEPEAKPATAKRGKAAKTEQAALDAAPLSAPAAPEVPCAPQRLGGFVCQIPEAWSLGMPPRAVDVALAQKPDLKRLMESSKRGNKSEFLDTIIAFDILRTAGPLVTLSEPESPLARMGKILAVSGQGVEGRVLVFPGAGGKVTPAKLTEAVLGHMQNAVVVEPLGVETVSASSGQRNIGVYKYIKVERRKEMSGEPDIGIDAKREEKIISIPHYHNMALSVVPRGDDLLMVIIIAPESKFLPQLEAVKVLVASAE
ncbi:hypothetical protein [Megalodesulfovibrio gigas]|uniref:Lipoprotein n=1 Tax=Megalodesulfovibrio gigas (strain ATCC 19364 / DSM 1382 / NCIMB 9332 / VKM B-1759) TaxID=1121448 RepID=T2GEH8_MEGG1|nr:hypothetical protein [Megalodesulfovibrio gigas]AGW14322.1 hypothetical protein DGI_2590 [Megalodesulfovibrio gigas DSM 1382 = ATCC 19364]